MLTSASAVVSTGNVARQIDLICALSRPAPIVPQPRRTADTDRETVTASRSRNVTGQGAWSGRCCIRGSRRGRSGWVAVRAFQRVRMGCPATDGGPGIRRGSLRVRIARRVCPLSSMSIRWSMRRRRRRRSRPRGCCRSRWRRRFCRRAGQWQLRRSRPVPGGAWCRLGAGLLRSGRLGVRRGGSTSGQRLIAHGCPSCFGVDGCVSVLVQLGVRVSDDVAHEPAPGSEEGRVIHFFPSVGRACQYCWRVSMSAGRCLAASCAGQYGGGIVGDRDVVGPFDQGHVGDLVDLPWCR